MKKQPLKMRSKGHSQNKLVRIITTPIRFLGKVRDMYMRGITKCSNNMNYSNPVDAASRFAALPRSYSAATSRSGDSEDFAELMRVASTRTLVNRVDVDLVLEQQKQQATTHDPVPVSSNGLPKSVSVGMGRIDEDQPYDLGEGDVPVVPDSYPRSRSYAVGHRRLAF